MLIAASITNESVLLYPDNGETLTIDQDIPDKLEDLPASPTHEGMFTRYIRNNTMSHKVQRAGEARQPRDKGHEKNYRRNYNYHL